MPLIWRATSARIMTSSPSSRCSSPTKTSWNSKASPPRTCRPASAASSSWPTRTPTVCSPWPPATSPNWHAAIRTIYGDAVGGYAPIKDLLKTRVWEISRWRNKAAAAGMGIGGLHVVGNEQGSAGTPLPDGVMIPVNSIEKAPSAELRPGQKDSDSLPEYALLDQVLAMYIEHAHGRADLLADGFDEATVDTVDAIGRPRRMEASPVSAGTEGDGAGVWA